MTTPDPRRPSIEALLPCPWCACTDVRLVDASRGWRTVRCYSCFARGPTMMLEKHDLDDDQLRNAWNRRPSSPSRDGGEVDLDALEILFATVAQKRLQGSVTLDDQCVVVEAQNPHRNVLGEVEDAREHWNPTQRLALVHWLSAIHNAAPALLSSLRASREREADLEMMLRAAFPDESYGDELVPFMSYGEACDGDIVFWVHKNADDLDPLTLDRDSRGLPILTDAARAVLNRTEKGQADRG